MGDDQRDIRELLEAHPKRDALARLVRTVAMSAADERRSRFSDGLDELLRELELEPEDGVVGSINVLRVLSNTEPPASEGREVLAHLLIRGLHLAHTAQDGDEADLAWARAAERLCWLAANTPLSALGAIDAELGEGATGLWDELRSVVAQADAGGASRGRGEALVAATALASSVSPSAQAALETLRRQLTDPLLRAAVSVSAPARVVEAQPAEDGEPSAARRSPERADLVGEIVPSPLGPVGLVISTVTGFILLRYLFRFVANVLLRFRRPVEIKLTPSGVSIESKLDVLGRTVRTEKTLIPLGNLARAVREVKYPRLSLYAGLLALSVGTFVGVSLATDGARAGSPSLLMLGAVIVVVGVALDMVFSTLLPGRTGQHRVLFVPRRGRTYAVRLVDDSAADRLLRTLASMDPKSAVAS